MSQRLDSQRMQKKEALTHRNRIENEIGSDLNRKKSLALWKEKFGTAACVSGDVDEDPDPDSEFEGGEIGEEHHSGKLFSHNSLSGLVKGCAIDAPADVENTIKFMAAGFSEESST